MSASTGRTLDQVLNPKKYPPFSGVNDKTEFDDVWRNNQDWVFACMAHAAYCEPGEMKEFFQNIGAVTKFYDSKTIDGVKKGRQGFLAVWNSGLAILSFRGTEGSEGLEIELPKTIRIGAKFLGLNIPKEISTFLATDIIDDLKIRKIQYKEAKVHKGFFDAATELWPEILADLKEREIAEPDRVYVTGHSLGAAMAVVAGMKHKFKKIITFGEPRVGIGIGNVLESAHVRYVNGNDPVTKIVPTFWPFSYEHHGELKSIEDDGGANVLYDHSIINYAYLLKTSSTLVDDFGGGAQT